MSSGSGTTSTTTQTSTGTGTSTSTKTGTVSRASIEKIAQKPNDQDVLFGRGNFTKNHPGNLHYRKLVNQARFIWRSTRSKKDKNKIAMQIIHKINHMNPPGRFVKLGTDKGSGAKIWQEVPFQEAFSKTQKALREFAAMELPVAAGARTGAAVHGKEGQGGERTSASLGKRRRDEAPPLHSRLTHPQAVSVALPHKNINQRTSINPILAGNAVRSSYMAWPKPLPPPPPLHKKMLTHSHEASVAQVLLSIASKSKYEYSKTPRREEVGKNERGL